MFYILNVFYYRKKGDFEDIVEEERIFRNENPIISREECFSAYQSHIDVMYEYLGKEYTSYEQAKKDLKDFFYSSKNNKIGLPLIENGIGIWIEFVYDENIEYLSKNKEIFTYNGVKKIHGLENEKDTEVNEISYNIGLKFEYDFYKKKGLEMQDVIEVPKIGKIMWTPLYEEKIKSL